MGAHSGADIVNDALVFAYDMQSTRSYGKNTFLYSTDLYSWFNSGVRCTLSRDNIDSPIGNTPLKLSITSDSDPYTNTYVGTQWIITEAKLGETWTASCWVRSSVPTVTAIWIFECGADGIYTGISNPQYSIDSTWKRISTTRTMTNANTGAITIRFDGPDSLGTGIDIWYDGLQLERNISASSFSKLYNYNQKDIKDWAGKNIISPANLAYNSDNTFQFNGSSSAIYLPDNIGYTSEYTQSAWFKSTGAPGGGYHIIFGGQEAELSIPTSGELRMGTFTTARYVGNVGSGLTDGNWHHVAVTYKPSQSILTGYIDGASVGTIATNGGTPTISFTRRMGQFGTNSTYWTNGFISSAQVYNRALTDTEVLQNFEATRSLYGI